MNPTRRQFIQQSGVMLGAAGIAALQPRLLYGQEVLPADGAALAAKPTLVVVYLRGGADPVNALVPYSDPMYYRVRPTIGVPFESSDPENPAVLRIANDKRFGFHPAMKELANLYDAGLLAPIIATGSRHPTRSHFDAQDFMERAAPGIKTITEGWLNRYLTATAGGEERDLRSVSLQPVLPRSLRGQYPVLAVPTYGAEDVMRMFETLYGCDSEKEAISQLTQAYDAEPTDSSSEASKPSAEQHTRQRIVESGSEGIRKLRHLNAIMSRPGGEGYPNHHFGSQMRDIAKIIHADEGLEITAVDYGGWDHHAYQGGASGTMAKMLGVLSQSIGAFVDDLGPRMDRTMILVMTEFGRTVRENGTNGSDHGHGGFMLAVGGPVKGGRVYGRWTGLDRSRLYEGRDLPIYTDFRDVFAETLLGLYGFDADANRFFPGYDANERALGFMRGVRA